MKPSASLLLLFASCGLGNPTEAEHGGHNVISKDVCIIGGGSSGTYSAIRLHQLGKSVALLEENSLLGGHTNTFTDPVTGAKINYGVVVLEELPVVRNYTTYLGVPLITLGSGFASSSIVTRYADISAGTILSNTTFPDDPSKAFPGYLGQFAKYPYLNNGFDLPDPVPEVG